ncbi:MAG: hypothetical protein D6690_17830, partial [Nitrospirae bacterium]
MPLRLLEAIVPGEAVERIPALIENFRVIHVRTSRSAEAAGLVTILVDANDAEAVSDLLVSHFGSHDSFRLILLPVEATLPV